MTERGSVSAQQVPTTSENDASKNEISGYVYKRRGGFGKHAHNAWLRRYCMIRDGILYYFDTDGSNVDIDWVVDIKQARGKLDLKEKGCLFNIGIQTFSVIHGLSRLL